LTESNVCQVFNAAKKYQVESLNKRCVAFLEKILTVANVCIFFAVIYDQEDLVKTCLDFIQRHTKDVLETNGFLDMENQPLVALVRHPQLRVSELELFEAVIKWAKTKCARSGMQESGENLREVLGDAVYEIRFATMKFEEFTSKVSPLNVLSTEELVYFYSIFTNPSVKSNAVSQFASKRREMSAEFSLEVCKEFEIVSKASNTQNTMSFIFIPSEPLVLKSLHFLLPVATPYPSTLNLAVQVNQAGKTLLNTSYTCQATQTPYLFKGQSFPVGKYVPQAVNLDKGVFEISVNYNIGNANVVNVTCLSGKGRTGTISKCGISVESYTTDGCLYSVEFSI
jgi:hypothetical protein